ncbi:hypothetical protein D770_04935 [Flammeovirgaceae bacterium 311]|nr:hypothetical protein D770_04935 [Flammeovirgaceae bacterium 311]
MRKLPLLSIFILMICAVDCQREGPDCHLSFEIMNNSQDEILIQSREANAVNASCSFQMHRIPPSSKYELRLKSTCWEDELERTGGLLQLFFFDASRVAGKPITECDDDLLNSQILERREISIDYLRRNNWKVVFP